jgi:hypothetical protein
MIRITAVYHRDQDLFTSFKQRKINFNPFRQMRQIGVGSAPSKSMILADQKYDFQETRLTGQRGVPVDDLCVTELEAYLVTILPSV